MNSGLKRIIYSGLWTLTFTFFLFQLSAQIDFEKEFMEHYPQESPSEGYRSTQSPNTGNYDAVFCKLELTVDPAEYYIKGVALHHFTPKSEAFNTMYFDFTKQIPVSEVIFNEENLEFKQMDTDELLVEFKEDLIPGEKYEIEIHYEGQPASSGFGSFATSTQCGDQEIPAMWTLSEPYGAKHWWPCKQTLNDKYDSIEMVIITPERYRAGSNGVLEEELIVDGGSKKYIWKHRYPVPAYLVAFAVSEYEVYSDWVPIEEGDSIEILNYIYPCNLDYAKERTPRTIAIMQFFREKFGEYPYIKEKYGHCNFGWGGGMEHSTMSFMGGFSHGLIAHELAHQWFGDKITCGSWQDIWLNEGFATYLEGLTYDFGADPAAWDSWKYYNRNRATNDTQRSVYVDDTTSVNRIFSGNLSYAKGAYLLHMLRFKMGDDTFFEAIYNYIHDEELIYDYAKTPDLQKHLEAASGMDLNEFFNDWLYGGGYPVYQVIYERKEGGIWIKLNQSPTNPSSVDFFEMPVPIYVGGFGEDTTIILDHQFSGQLFEIDIPFTVANVEFDPQRWLCAQSEVLTAVSDPGENDFAIFPNPATEFVKIRSGFQGVVQIEMMDLLGKSVYSGSINTAKDEFSTIDVSALKSGIYLMNINGKNKLRKTIRLIIE